MTKHEITLYWSDTDQEFIAEAPELPGCTADGSTRQEALANAEVTGLAGSSWFAAGIETSPDTARRTP